jgi:hypothetical protein
MRSSRKETHLASIFISVKYRVGAEPITTFTCNKYRIEQEHLKSYTVDRNGFSTRYNKDVLGTLMPGRGNDHSRIYYETVCLGSQIRESITGLKNKVREDLVLMERMIMTMKKANHSLQCKINK